MAKKFRSGSGIPGIGYPDPPLITSNGEFVFIAFVCLTFVTLIRILTTTPVVPTLASETQLLLKLNMECNLLKEYNLLKEGQYHDPEIHASPIDVNNTTKCPVYTSHILN